MKEISTSEKQLTQWAKSCQRINHMNSLVQREIDWGNPKRAKLLSERARLLAWSLVASMVRSGAKKPSGYPRADEAAK